MSTGTCKSNHSPPRAHLDLNIAEVHTFSVTGARPETSVPRHVLLPRRRAASAVDARRDTMRDATPRRADAMRQRDVNYALNYAMP